MASFKNPALVVTADHKISIEEAPIHEPGPSDVLIHVRATGICGSDIHFWKHGRIGDLVFDGDCILGHEGAGVVVKTGANVKHLQIGDRVAIEPGVPCNDCFLCADGRPNLCEAVAFSGVYPYHGTLQRFKVHPAKYAHKLPDSIDFTSAASLEPLSVALHALRTTPIHVGTPVAVFGAGPIGLLTMAVARASGAHPIVVSDVDEARLRFARDFEPHCLIYKVSPQDTPEDSAKNIRALFSAETTTHDTSHSEYDMPQLVLECTGIESSIVTAAFAVRRGGTINVVGVSSKPNISNVPFMHLSLAEVQLRFINRYHDTWPAAIRALQGGLIDPEKVAGLVTQRFRLEEAVQAMEAVGRVREPEAGQMVVKVQVVDGEL